MFVEEEFPEVFDPARFRHSPQSHDTTYDDNEKEDEKGKEKLHDESFEIPRLAFRDN